MMNPALIAVTVMMESRRKLVLRLREEGATAPERARPLSAEEVRLLDGVIQEGIVREAAPGTFYVDEAKYAESIAPPHRSEKVRQAWLAVGVLLLVVAMVVVLAVMIDT